MAAKSSDWRPGPTVCRCCLTEGCYKDISTEYFWMGKREVYSEMLLETFDLTVAYAQTGGPNSNSRLICEPCISRLRDACDFKRQVVECERVFHQHLAGGSDDIEGSSETVLRSLLEKDVKQEMGTVKVEIEAKMSDDEDFGDHGASPPDDDDDDLDDQPLTKLATKVPKKETVDLMDLMDNAKPEKRKSTTKVKTTPSKKVKKKETPKPSASKAVKPPAEKKKKGVALDSDLDLRRPKWNAEKVVEYSTVYPFRLRADTTIVCVYCLEEYTNPDEFREHMDESHKKFTTKTAFAHVSGRVFLKVDYTNLRCRICDESSETIDDVARHLQETHDIDIDLEFPIELHAFKLETDNWVCVMCQKKFPTINKLCRHTLLHYLKYTCDVCGKSYSTNDALKYHVRCNHVGNLACRKCWKEFPTMEDKREHIRSSKRCHPFMCTTCGERFLSWETKDKHKIEEHSQPKKIYECPDCHEVYDNRRQFYKHYKLTHTDESFQCSCCGVKFETQHKLEDHRIIHTGEKNFHCDVCFKSFTRIKSLKQHMWIHSETKRFPCVICERQFAQKISLKGHMKSHHPGVEVVF